MKIKLIIVLFSVLAFLLSGCVGNITPSYSPPTNVEISSAPSPSLPTVTESTSAISPSPSAVTETSSAASPSPPDVSETASDLSPSPSSVNGWSYYLDTDNPVDSPDSEEPLYYLHRTKDGVDEDLGITCFSFDFAGDYLYTDSNLVFGDFGHWDSFRYNLDGSGKKELAYGDMTRFSDGKNLYFSLFDESAFYTATTACTQVKKHDVAIPDEQEIRDTLDYNYECNFVFVYDVNDGWVYFNFEVTDTGPFTYFVGQYRTNLETGKTEKVDDGEYFSNDWE